MSKKTEPYDRLSEKAKRGEYQLASPMDEMLLSFLPNQGELFAGLYPLGETVKAILKKFSPEQQKLLDTKAISSRLRVLHQQDLAVPIYSGNTGGGKMVWQRTLAAEKIVIKWKAEQNGNS